MLNGSVTERYTEGLFQAARNQGAVDQVDVSLGLVAQALQDIAQLRALLEHPVITPEEKAGIVAQSFGDALHPVVLTFLRLLFVRKRSAYIGAVREAFHAKANENRGRVEVYLESARELSQAQFDRITHDLEGATQKQIEAHVSVDPDLIAGYRLRLGNRIVDASISGFLSQFSDALSGRRVV